MQDASYHGCRQKYQTLYSPLKTIVTAVILETEVVAFCIGPTAWSTDTLSLCGRWAWFP